MSPRVELNFVIAVNSIETCFPIYMISIRFAVFLTVLLSILNLFIIACCIVLNMTKGSENDSRHFELLFKAELLIQTFRRFILMSNEDEGLVASFDD